MKNSIFTISPYKHYGGWVFDDDRVGLVKEAFVAGADTLLDKMAEGRDRVTLNFADFPFPDHDVMVDRVEAVDTDIEGYGTNYYCKEFDHDLWLCPALNLYYPESPKQIFIKVIKTQKNEK